MAERLPSLDLIASEVRAEREAQSRHADALEAKAGIVLGFAGAIVAVSATRIEASVVPGTLSAVGAVLQCLIMFGRDRFPRLDLRRLRDDFVRSEPAFTRLSILDAQVFMIDQQLKRLRSNEHPLRVR